MSQLPFSLVSNSTAHRVAIIGAGAGGAATAFHLHQHDPTTSITVYEASSYIGGRSTTIDIFGQPIELGASIFVDVNMNLVSAAKLFNLTMIDPDESLTPTQNGLGIWNGREFVYSENGGWSFFNLAKLVWRYGLSPYRAQKHVSSVVDRFLGIYNRLPFSSLTSMAAEMDLLQDTNRTSHAAYAEAGVSEHFIQDIVNAATRVNYAQSVESLHGLMGAVAFVTDGAKAIKGGNWRLFSNMVRHSQADVSLNTRVSSITQLGRDDGMWEVCHRSACETFHHVVVAAPWHQTNISVMGAEETRVSVLPVEYVVLHITIVATAAAPSQVYFGTPNKPVPASILTTTTRDGKDPEFFSFSVVGNAGGRVIYKLFSETHLSDSDLRRFFEGDGIRETDIVQRKTWQAYPKAPKTADFDEWEVAPGLWYLNGMERFISTMETATLAGRNVAGLIHARLSAS